MILVRHGRSTSNTSGTLAGWTPGVELDDTGRQGARDAAARLGGVQISALVTSPLLRCRQTASILAQPHPGLSECVDDGLGECRYGAWTGRKISELVKDPLWRTVQDTPSRARFPDSEEFPAESLAAMSARAVDAVRRIDAKVEAEHGSYAVWVAVSHGDVIKAILAHSLGMPLDAFQRIVVAPASMSVVHLTAKRPMVLQQNHLNGDLDAILPRPADTPVGDATPGGDR